MFKSLIVSSNHKVSGDDKPIGLLLIVLILLTPSIHWQGVTGLRCRLDEGPSDAELKRVTRNCMKKFGESYYNMGIMNLDMQQQPRKPQSDYRQQSQYSQPNERHGGQRNGADRNDRKHQRGQQMSNYYDGIEDGSDENYYDFADSQRNGRNQQQYQGNGQRNGQRNNQRSDNTDTISYNGYYNHYNNNNNNNNNNDNDNSYGRRNQQQNYSNNNRNNNQYYSGSNNNNQRDYNDDNNRNNNNHNYNNNQNNHNNHNNNNNNHNNNNNNNRTTSNNNDEEDDAGVCIVHCFFEQLHMLNGLDYPDRHKVMYVLTRDIRDRELRNFYVDTIQECFRYLELQRRRDKCQFSRDLINCMNEYAKGYCDDWDTFNLMFN